jgi:hypothetical protein
MTVTALLVTKLVGPVIFGRDELSTRLSVNDQRANCNSN